jgi:hypothetical protein
MTDREQLESYVDAGIALLDEKGPENWRGKIDLGILNIDDHQDCILGQLYGRFGYGSDHLGHPSLRENGFWPLIEIDDCANMLTEIWKEKLTASSVPSS